MFNPPIVRGVIEHRQRPTDELIVWLQIKLWEEHGIHIKLLLNASSSLSITGYVINVKLLLLKIAIPVFLFIERVRTTTTTKVAKNTNPYI